MSKYLPDWMQDAECAIRDHDKDMWFSDCLFERQAAKRICHTCPVKTQCLEFADQEGYDYGIWGGLSEYERRQIKNTKNTPKTLGSDNYKKAS